MSKTKDLKYQELKLQEYLSDEGLNIRQKRLAFKLRTRTVKFENNMGKKVPCLMCEKPETEDSQQHHLRCDEIKRLCPDTVNSTLNYDDLFSNNVSKIQNIVKVFDVTIR